MVSNVGGVSAFLDDRTVNVLVIKSPPKRASNIIPAR